MTPAKQETEGTRAHFRNLLIFLLIYIFASPFMVPYRSVSVLAHVMLSMALFFAVYTVQRRRHERSIVIILLVPMLGLYWLGIYDMVRFTRPGSYLFCAVYFGMLTYSYIRQLATTRKVTINVLYMILCLYLIIGLFWGSLYALLNELSPGAFAGALLEDVQGETLHIFNYFSMVTLTTLGYGDITPQLPGAASLCQLEAIVGQFFTAVLVAWFIGVYISDKHDEQAKRGQEERCG